MDKFKQGGNWWIRDRDGKPVNLNSPQGADYALALQAQVARLEAAQVKRGRPRKKVGPKETKA